MTSAAYPTVYAALVSTIDAAIATRVTDGYDTSSDQGDVVMIGVPNIADTNAISAGSFTQSTATMGTPRSREETGSINGLALAWNGDGSASAARLAAFALIASIEGVLRATPALGVTSFGYLVAQMNTGDVVEDKEDGATCAISFTVTYAARI